MKLSIGFLTLLLLALPAWADYGEQPPIRLSIDEPKRSKNGLLLASGWNLSFRLKAQEWVGYFNNSGEFGRAEALILKDPDNCLNLSEVLPSGDVVDPACTIADETFVNFRTSRNDFPRSGRCARATDNHLIDARLDDLIATNGFDSANKVYLRNNSGAPIAVPPTTGGDIDSGIVVGGIEQKLYCDDFGYGHDNNLPGLVVMVDIGPNRFYDLDFNPLHPHLHQAYPGDLKTPPGSSLA